MKFQRKLSLLLLTLCLVLALSAAAQGAEKDPYVLTCGDSYAYITPFAVEHTVFRRDGTLFFSGREVPRIRCLTGEGGRSIAAYSIDAFGESFAGHCRRTNLEDSPFFSDTAAGKLRAISENGFPRKSIAALQEAANGWLTEQGLSKLENLQTGEAILAAQIAIWKVAGGNNYQVTSLYSGIQDLTGMENRTLHTEDIRQRETENTAGNISGLYAYFCNLAPLPPRDVLLSDASITRTVYTCVRDEEGYTAEVSVTAEASAGENDSLILRAVCEGQVQEQPITGSGEYCCTFAGLAERSAVRVTIYGEQHGADVYLFEAEGSSLLGYDDSCLPVRCERILTPVPVLPDT